MIKVSKSREYWAYKIIMYWYLWTYTHMHTSENAQQEDYAHKEK